MPNFKTTTRGMNKARFVPNKDAMMKALETASTPETADYAAQQVEERLGKNDATEAVIIKFKNYATSVRGIYNKQTNGGVWSGEEASSQFQSFQEFLADSSVQNIKDLFKQANLLGENGELKGELQLDFAVNEEAQFVRAYKLNDQPIKNKAMVELLDDAFKAWLAEKGMFYKDGQLYEVDDMGKIKQDKNGQDILMDREDIFNRLQDDKNGFAAYLKDQGIQSKVVRRAFPTTAPAVGETQGKQVVEASLKKGIKVEGMADEEGVDVHPDEEAPSTGPSSTSGGGA